MTRRLSSCFAALVWLAVTLSGCRPPDDAGDAPPEVPAPTPEEERPPVGTLEERQNHYLCYRDEMPPQTPIPILPAHLKLHDQFTPEGQWKHFLGYDGGERFCNPVQKRRHSPIPTEIVHEEDHLFAVPGTVGLSPEHTGAVTVFNQFFREGQQLRVHGGGTDPPGLGNFLMLPSWKIAMSTKPQDDPLHPRPNNSPDHFLCYEATGDAPPAGEDQVELTDQYRLYPEVTVGEVALLCNPTEKIHGDANPVHRRYPDDHLVCYQVRGEAAVTYTFWHQLLPTPAHRDSLTATALEWLCVPSSKQRGDGWWSPGQGGG